MASQTDAISEALSEQIASLSDQVRHVIIGQRIQLALLLVVLAAVLAPYIAAWANLAS